MESQLAGVTAALADLLAVLRTYQPLLVEASRRMAGPMSWHRRKEPAR